MIAARASISKGVVRHKKFLSSDDGQCGSNDDDDTLKRLITKQKGMGGQQNTKQAQAGVDQRRCLRSEALSPQARMLQTDANGQSKGD